MLVLQLGPITCAEQNKATGSSQETEVSRSISHLAQLDGHQLPVSPTSVCMQMYICFDVASS